MKPLKKILFIDDDSDILMISKFSLEALERVESPFLTSGEEAVKVLGEFNPDLIILDVMMPVMDGVATFNAIKKNPQFAKTPIVFLTASLLEQDIKKYYELGAIEILKKPFDPISLPQMILDVWEKSQTVT